MIKIKYEKDGFNEYVVTFEVGHRHAVIGKVYKRRTRLGGVAWVFNGEDKLAPGSWKEITSAFGGRKVERKLADLKDRIEAEVWKALFKYERAEEGE